MMNYFLCMGELTKAVVIPDLSFRIFKYTDIC